MSALKQYSPLGERLHVKRLIAKYEYLCSEPYATIDEQRFLARLRGRLAELEGNHEQS